MEPFAIEALNLLHPIVLFCAYSLLHFLATPQRQRRFYSPQIIWKIIFPPAPFQFGC